MSTLPPDVVARLWQTIAEHPRGGCPRCGTRLCWIQAEARGQLIAHGLWPAPENDRPHPTAG